jgi:hypothetical protein
VGTGAFAWVRKEGLLARNGEWQAPGLAVSSMLLQVILGFDESFVQRVWMRKREFDVRFAVNRSLFNRLQVC